jgi:Ca-activated chloride channel family protein
MRFENPHFDVLVIAAIIAILFYAWSFKRRRNLAKHFVDKSLLENLASALSIKKRSVKAFLVSFAVLLAIFSLMRPQWGFKWQEVKRKGLDILVAMDVSKSMLSRDVKPNRLERAKLAVRDLVGKLRGDRIGLIAFAGSAFLQAPLTLDYGAFLLALDDLDTTIIPRPGTAIASAIQEARKVFKGPEKNFKVLILITDGEDHEGDPLKASAEAQKEGVRIYCVGVGTKEGDLIPQVGELGERGYLKDKEGKVVKSALNEDLLQKIALNTGGSYVRATGAEFGLDLLYDQKISKLEKHELERQMRKTYMERFQIFLGIAALILFLEPLISERR